MSGDENRTVNVGVQVLPLLEDVYPVVDRAIEVIARAGVKYEVGPMETVMEGRLDELLEIAKAAHLACFEAGAEQVVTIIKIGDRVAGTTMEEKVRKYRSEHGGS
ncbi:MAG: MTH1187 family thiamine-binding protein [Anaerolineales bacterium]|nr:MTH1187 family thiamine-binding protein [Anaerolineales bacterium]